MCPFIDLSSIRQHPPSKESGRRVSELFKNAFEELKIVVLEAKYDGVSVLVSGNHFSGNRVTIRRRKYRKRNRLSANEMAC